MSNLRKCSLCHVGYLAEQGHNCPLVAADHPLANLPFEPNSGKTSISCYHMGVGQTVSALTARIRYYDETDKHCQLCNTPCAILIHKHAKENPYYSTR